METIDGPHSLNFMVGLLQGHSEVLGIDPVLLSIQVLVMLLGLVLSAIFSGSEVAFFSLANRIEDLSGEDAFRISDERLTKMLSKPRRLLATILIGNTFANIVASVLAAVITGELVAYFGWPEVIVFSIEVIVLTFMILILSEITPKIISINNPLKVSRAYSGFIYWIYVILTPFSKLIADSTISLERYLPKPVSKMTSDDIRTMAEVSEQEGSIKEDEREIIENVIEFGNITVREIMTSRVNIVAVSVEDSLQDVLKTIRENGLSRMPLYENDLDDIKGVIYAKDVLPYLNSEEEQPFLSWMTCSATFSTKKRI